MATHDWRRRKGLTLDVCANCGTRRQSTLAGLRYVLLDGTWVDEEPPCPDYEPTGNDTAVVEYLVDAFLETRPDAHFGPGHVELSDGNWEKHGDFARLAARCACLVAHQPLDVVAAYAAVENREYAYGDVDVRAQVGSLYREITWDADIGEDYDRFVVDGEGAELIRETMELALVCAWVLSGRKTAPPRVSRYLLEWEMTARLSVAKGGG